MPVQQLKEFLDEAGVEYMCLSHPLRIPPRNWPTT